MLIKSLLAATLLIAAAPGLQAKDDPTSQQLLESVLKQHNFIQAVPAPFALEADFTGQANVPIKGHLRLRWQSQDHWWTRVDYGPFQQIRIRNGEMEYTLRNLEFTPLQVMELFNLLEIDADSAPFKVKKVVTKTEAGISMVCLQDKPNTSFKSAHEYCADTSSHDLVSESWNDAPNQSRRQRFADYVSANGLLQAKELRYPRRLEMYINSAKLVTANITLFQSMPFDVALLIPPQGAIERRKCANMKQAVPVKKPAMNFGHHPGLYSQNVLVMTVLTDGSVDNIHVIQSGGSLVDKPAIEAFSKWRFRPAMCGNQPVLDEFTVETTVRFRNVRYRPGIAGEFTLAIRPLNSY